MVKLLIADDHDLITVGLKTALSKKFVDAQIDSCSSKKELDFYLSETAYDLLILDINFGQANAKTFINDIRKNYEALKVLVLSSLDDKYTIQLMVNAGVEGYLIKSDSIVDILNAVDQILDGNAYFSIEVQSKLENTENAVVLTNREKEVLGVILEEKSTKEIAEILNISEKTVEMHRGNLFQKLDVKNVAGLVKKAILLNLLAD